MEIIVSLGLGVGALAVLVYLLSNDFRATANNYRRYDWRLLIGSLLLLLIACWSLPLILIKDKLSPALRLMFDVHANSLRPAPYRPDSSYFDYFRRLLAQFALFTFITSGILAWLAHCIILLFRQRRRKQ